MKGSSATSARAKAAPRLTGRSSDKPRPTPTNAEDFALVGPSDRPDPAFNAYRKGLADVALADRVIASHYAEPVLRTIVTRTKLRSAPSEAADEIRQLAPGDPFQMLDESVGWVWGYAGTERRVGYVKTAAVLGER